MYNIAVIPGDGTGPEVVREGLKVLRAVSEKFGFEYELTEYDFGGDRYLRTGDILPKEALEELRHYDAIYLGAIGHPDCPPGLLEKGILLTMRFELDLYINLRPVKLYPGVDCPLKDKGPEDIDFVVVRENTEDLYVGAGGVYKKGTPDEIAIQESINTRKGVERCVRYAFNVARERNKQNKVTLCAKTNVLTYAHDLWERVFYEVAEEYEDIILLRIENYILIGEIDSALFNYKDYGFECNGNDINEDSIIKCLCIAINDGSCPFDQE